MKTANSNHSDLPMEYQPRMKMKNEVATKNGNSPMEGYKIEDIMSSSMNNKLRHESLPDERPDEKTVTPIND